MALVQKKQNSFKVEGNKQRDDTFKNHYLKTFSAKFVCCSKEVKKQLIELYL